MHVVVFTRSTPDTAAKVEVGADGKVTWGDAATVVNPWDEYALEEGILQAKNGGGKATVITIGGEMHNESLKHSLAMGLDEAVRIEDAALDATNSLAYATAAAAAVLKLGDVNLVICGKESVDVGTDQHIYQMARKLGWTLLAYVSKILEVDYAAGFLGGAVFDGVGYGFVEGEHDGECGLPRISEVLDGVGEVLARGADPIWIIDERDGVVCFRRTHARGGSHLLVAG